MFAGADFRVAIGRDDISNTRCDITLSIAVSKSHPVWPESIMLTSNVPKVPFETRGVSLRRRREVRRTLARRTKI